MASANSQPGRRQPASNILIAALLREYADLLELRGESAFRTQAYRRGAEAIAGYDHAVAPLNAAQLQQIEGVGKGISTIIVEIVARGTFGGLEELRQVIPASVITFTAIPGIGVKSAARLYETLHVSTLDDLRAAALAGRIAQTKGLGARVERSVIEGLAQLDAYAGRHSIGIARPLGELLVRLLRERGFAQVSTVGSVRRGAETVGNIDLLVTSDDPAAALSAFAALPPVGEVNERADALVNVTLDDGLTAQLIVVPPQRWGTQLVARTATEGHRAAIRALGAQRHHDDIFAEDFADEATLYAALGLPLIPPELREGRGEVEAALAGQLPRLISLGDLRGDLHSHSTWSDGHESIEEMARAAIAHGHAYLSVSDHTHSLVVANGLDATRLRAQWREIDRLNAELPPFRLLKSAEVEIRADGTLDFPDDILAELDLVIASLHSGLRGDRETVTKRLLRAINNPHVDIIAHPSGRIVGGRGGADYDWEAIFAAAVATGTALEINASPERLDLNEERARQAVAAGVLLTIDSDAHAASGLAILPYGIAVARRAWVSPSHVLNTRPLDDLLAWAKEGRKPG